MGFDLDQHELDRLAAAGIIRPEDARPPQPPKEKRPMGSMTLPKKPAPPAVRFAVSLALPVTVVSEMNQRCHFMARRRRFDKQADALVKAITALDWYSEVLGYRWPFGFPVTVTFTRWHNRGQGMDDDNIRSAFKALRDAVAEWAGVDDKDPGIVWVYSDREGKPGVTVTVEGVAG